MATEILPGGFHRHLGSTTQFMCVWFAACREVLEYAVRAEAITLTCPRTVEARIFVFTHMLHFLHRNPPSTCVYPGTSCYFGFLRKHFACCAQNGSVLCGVSILISSGEDLYCLFVCILVCFLLPLTIFD